jgi:prepilin-type N-terminal cleavage/methylation domain-containing protein
VAYLTPHINRPAAIPRGFTLVEAMVASVVLAVAVLGASTAIVASQQQNLVQQEDSAAVALARQLIEEIASRPLSLPDATPGWPTVTDRSSYDTISDYSGYTDTVTLPIYHTNSVSNTANFTSALPAGTPITTGASSVALGANQYLRTVIVTYPTSIFGATVTSGDFAVVVVTVHGANDVGVTLSRVLGEVSLTR